MFNKFNTIRPYTKGETCRTFPVYYPPQHQDKEPGMEYLMKPLPVFDNFNYRGSGKLKDKVAINGSNGSGKTTFVRALMQMPGIVYDGDWQLPKRSDIGYVDQHYANLDLNSTVFQTIKDMNVFVTDQDIRKHLNSFLFRKNEEVFAKVSVLSGGEKARLSLAKIAAKPPKLLILDEISNNVDLDTKSYILNVLRQYPGAFVLISHEKAFINSLPLTAQYMIRNGVFMNQK